MRHKSTHWVFGYGSLIWRPGFAFVSRQPALLVGAHRRLCVYSHRHRGTAARPGLVFGLVRGGSCRGMAFEVEAERWDEVHAYLSAREMDQGVYREVLRSIRPADGTSVTALAFVVYEGHVPYAGRIALARRLGLLNLAGGLLVRIGGVIDRAARRFSGCGHGDIILDSGSHIHSP